MLQGAHVTLDIDWAPDVAIDFAAEILVRHGVRATWFVTHASPAVTRLRGQADQFELGIHPNFLAHSSHGQTPDEILAHCLELVPDATSARMHGLVQSTQLLDRLFTTTSVHTDASLFLPRTPHLQPLTYDWRRIPYTRIPYFWEDDIEMERAQPDWHAAPLLALPGLKVFNFHPIHVFLNSADMAPYFALKQSAPRLAEVDPEIAATYALAGIGTRSVFEAVVRHLAATAGSATIRDLRDRWQEVR